MIKILENTNKENSEKSEINILKGTIDSLKKELSELNKMRGEYENVRHQVQHINTFRRELTKERDEHEKTKKNYELIISELKSKIDYLQLTPAKRKKVDEAKSKTSESSNNVTVLEVVSDPNDPSATKDGGSF